MQGLGALTFHAGENPSITGLALHVHVCRRRQWHPTPVLLPGESHGQRGLVGCSPWGRWRVGHDWVTSLSLFTFMHWRRKWQPTPVFLPGEPQGRGSLVGCHLWGRTESDTTEVTEQQQQHTRLLCIQVSTSMDSSNLGSCGTVASTLKQICKWACTVLSKGQLY